MHVADVTPEIDDEATDLRPENEEKCSACAHPRDAHDAIGTRFCRATIAGGLARGCACGV